MERRIKKDDKKAANVWEVRAFLDLDAKFKIDRGSFKAAKTHKKMPAHFDISGHFDYLNLV